MENKFKWFSLYSNEIILFLFSFIVLFFNSKCSPLYALNGWDDPNIYFTIGKSLFHEKVMYKDLFDHKGPMIFFIYGFGSLISFKSFLGIYIIQSLLLFINLLYVYKIAKLFLKNDYALLVSLLFTFLLLCRTASGGSAEEFLLPFLTISLYYSILYSFRSEVDRKTICKYLFIHGLMFGLVFFIKLSYIVYWIPLLFIPFYKLLKGRKYKDILFIIGAFIGGAVIVAIPVIFYFVLNSAFQDFIFAYIDFNKLYASRSFGFHFDAFANIAARFYHRVMQLDLYLYVILLGLGVVLLSKKYLKNIVDKMCIILSFIFLYIMATSGPFDLDYPYIILSIWGIPTFIFIVDFAGKYYKGKTNNIFKSVIIISVFLAICINIRFFGEDIRLLLEGKKSDHWQIRFAEKINSEKDPTLITLWLDLDVFTVSGVIPQDKYFFHPNILDTDFPDIRDSFIENIRVKKSTFILTRSIDDYPLLLDNYNIIDLQCFHEDACVYLLARKEE